MTRKIIQMISADGFSAVYKAKEGGISYCPCACFALVETESGGSQIRAVVAGQDFCFADDVDDFIEIAPTAIVESGGYDVLVESLNSPPAPERVGVPRFTLPSFAP